jgi:hypothetical protein
MCHSPAFFASSTRQGFNCVVMGGWLCWFAYAAAYYLAYRADQQQRILKLLQMHCEDEDDAVRVFIDDDIDDAIMLGCMIDDDDVRL